MPPSVRGTAPPPPLTALAAFLALLIPPNCLGNLVCVRTYNTSNEQLVHSAQSVQEANTDLPSLVLATDCYCAEPRAILRTFPKELVPSGQPARFTIPNGKWRCDVKKHPERNTAPQAMVFSCPQGGQVQVKGAMRYQVCQLEGYPDEYDFIHHAYLITSNKDICGSPWSYFDLVISQPCWDSYQRVFGSLIFQDKAIASLRLGGVMGVQNCSNCGEDTDVQYTQDNCGPGITSREPGKFLDKCTMNCKNGTKGCCHCERQRMVWFEKVPGKYEDTALGEEAETTNKFAALGVFAAGPRMSPQALPFVGLLACLLWLL